MKFHKFAIFPQPSDTKSHTMFTAISQFVNEKLMKSIENSYCRKHFFPISNSLIIYFYSRKVIEKNRYVLKY